MLTVWKKTDKNEELREAARIDYGCWIDLVDPTEKELDDVSKKTGALIEHLKSPLDEDEKSRIDIEEESTLFIFRVPEKQNSADERATTIPIGIVITKKNIISVCSKRNEILKDFYENKVRGVFTNKKTRLLLQFFSRTIIHYLRYLNKIESSIDKKEKILLENFRNSDMVDLLGIEKTLVYFNTAVISNGNVLDKILKGKAVKIYKEDEDILEDIIIENRQAIEMVKVYSSIVSNTMDAYASIVSNNLNSVMKVLTSITIILSLPIFIASLYGMNVVLPFQNNPYAFYITLLISFLVSGMAALIFYKKKWL